MLGFSIKFGITALFSSIIIFFYYFVFTFHNESFSGSYLFYITLLTIGYSIYKFFAIQFSEEKYTFSPLTIISLFIVHLFILCLCFFNMNNLTLGYSIILVLNIIFYSLLPVLLIFLSHSFGEKILNYIPSFKSEDSIFKVVGSFGIGFFALITILTFLSFFGQLTPIIFIITLFCIVGFCYKNIRQNFHDFFGLRWELESHDFNSHKYFKLIQPYTLTTEFLFIVITALISVNLINIVRPFPIGWDDLGVYMNYANLIGNSGKMLLFGQMSSWQVFTGIGYMFGSSSQAFFLNSFSGIVSTLIIIFTIKHILKSGDSEEHGHFFGLFKTKEEVKHFINIPLLMGAIYISLPMVIFHLAKDMKLDQGLLFVSISGIFILYYTLLSIEKRSVINNLLYIFSAGAIIGFAFSIKLTSLLLISSGIGLLVYSQMGVAGFVGFASLFFAFFTKFHLWSFLNVVYPKDDIFLINMISGSLTLLGLIAIIVAIQNKGLHLLKKTLQITISFVGGVLVALSPWIIWNIQTTDTINIGYIINGKPDSYIPDYTLIRGEDYVSKKLQESTIMTSSGKTLSEDYGRYFGYEDGINNYLKIFWNVSMQVNQKGEFTEISYIFFALIPSLFLFLPTKRKLFEYTIYGILGLSVLTLMISSSSSLLTNIFAKISLPTGYAFILIPYIILVALTILGIDSNKSKLLRFFVLNIIMMVFYVFLWTISSFGIVWYGISMYFFFLITIAICLYFISGYTGEHSDAENKIKAFASYFIFGIISIYFLFSSFPHLLINLQSAGYTEFKVGSINEKESVFQSHEEYLDFLFELNIDESKKSEFLETYKSELLENIGNSTQNGNELKNIVENVKNIKTFEKLLQNINTSPEVTDISLKNHARKVKNNLYTGIIYPNDRFKNNSIVYRAGTFMKYFISDNTKRVFEDNLLDTFNTYVYDENPDVTVERFKKLGVKNLLIDLNAATIDNDPRRDLTKRYERMLTFLTSDKLEYVGSDSICFSVGLDVYKKSEKKEKDIQEFLTIAGANYDSLMPDGTTINRNQKITSCFLKIKDLVTNNKVTETSPDVLKNIYNYVNNPSNNIKTDQEWINSIGKIMHPGFKVLFKIKD